MLTKKLTYLFVTVLAISITLFYACTKIDYESNTDFLNIENFYKVSESSPYFRFSTLETPYDMEHPVAGTREFGIYNSTANPNQFTFYTMGVDRAWDIPSMIANGLANGFERGDDLLNMVI